MNLFDKYNVPVPRYTSYPTVPYWENNLDEKEWKNQVKNLFDISNSNEGISLYIHLPFCESLCTYCACNTRITKNHGVELVYMSALIKEWNMYIALFKERPKIKELHLGGGTPTFFSAQNLWVMLKEILSKAEVPADADFSFEAHPANTSKEHLSVLQSLGFHRLSLGIQDFDPTVQKAINRHQTPEMVEETVRNARKLNYNSINFDLIYGLPFQTEKSIEETIKEVIKLQPTRIAFYSYAHVPWLKPGQRGYEDADLPQGEEKRKLFEKGTALFLEAGYVPVGFDHYALPDDELAIAQKEKKLHRNFMGYTTRNTKLLVGLGASSISDAFTAFAQNEKKVEDYYKAVNAGIFPVTKGHVFNEDDSVTRKWISDIMCKQELKTPESIYRNKFEEGLERLKPLESDGLVKITNEGVSVTDRGTPFLRNIALCFDARYHAKEPAEKKFSSGV